MKQHIIGLFRKRDNNVMKILLLGLGLAMGLVLIAKVYYERVYDNYMDDADRVYIVISDYSTSEGAKEFSQTPGAIAPGIKAYAPAVEAATRTTGLASDIDCSIVGKDGLLTRDKYLARSIIFADSSFFDIFTRKVVGNDPKEGLNIKNHIYISRSFAQKFSATNPDGIIGSMLSPTYLGGGEIRFVVDGIYDDFPENSSFSKTDIILSMPSMGMFTYDGTNNWVGNDRYQSYVKLVTGSSAADVDKGIAEMCLKQLPLEDLEKSGTKISFHIEPLATYNIKSSDVSKICTMLLIMAAVVLVASILNYVLIAISAMVYKTKMVAVRKCYGASAGSIYRMVFGETLLHLLISIALACLILYSFRGSVEEIIGASLGGMITWGSGIVMAVICLLVFLFCGLMPGMVYAKIPVAAAFRSCKESSRKWNPILLFVQFGMSAFFVTILAVSIMQYNHMINSDPGYAYKNVAMVNLSDAYASKKDVIKEQIARLPFVELTSSCYNLPIHWPSGNNIMLPDDDKEYFNIADMYFAGNDYFKLLDIKIVEGRNFTQDPSVTNEVIVSRSFVKKMEQMAGWKDGAIGKSILVTEHSQSANDIFTICGVYDDYLIGSYSGQDVRPSVQFYSGKMENENSYKDMDWLLIKLRDVNQQNIAAIDKIIKGANPEGDANVTLYASEMVDMYKDSKKVKNSIMISGLIVLVITLIGLLGYTQDEINRRRSEIAVRKINGATVPEILRLFMNKVLKLALPAAAIGVVAAYFVSEAMLELYTIKIALSWWIFALGGVFILLAVSAVVLLRTYGAANINPIKNLRTT